MTKEDQNVIEAKRTLKSHIKFFESLLFHLNGNDEAFKSRAMWVSWCLHRYLNDKLITDVEEAMFQQGVKSANDEKS